MKRSEVQQIVFTCLNDYLEAQEITIVIDGHTRLLGKHAVLDSMGLVNVIIDIESTFLDKDLKISLTSEKAFSWGTSPFRTVATLVDFIVEGIGETR